MLPLPIWSKPTSVPFTITLGQNADNKQAFTISPNPPLEVNELPSPNWTKPIECLQVSPLVITQTRNKLSLFPQIPTES